MRRLPWIMTDSSTLGGNPMIFVDTGAWIALSDKSDQYHQRAEVIYSRLKRERIKLLTTDYVIDETVTRLR